MNKKTDRVYRSIVSYLGHHKRLSLILSHGGIHLTVLLLLFVLIVIFSVRLHYMSKRDYVVNTITIEDIGGNSVMDFFRLKIGLSSYSNSHPVDYYNEILSTHFDIKKISISQTPLAPIAKYTKIDTLTNFGDYDQVANDLCFNTPDSIFYNMLSYYPRKKLRNELAIEFHDSLYLRQKRLVKEHDRARQEYRNQFTIEGAQECMRILREVIPLKNTFITDSSSAKDIRIAFTAYHEFGESVKNTVKKREDSTLIIEPINIPTGIIYTGTRQRINSMGTKAIGNIWGKRKNNPYYMGRLIFNVPDYRLSEHSAIELDFTPKPEKANSVVVFDHVYPEPTEITVNKVIYKGKKAMEEAFRSGIYIEAHDVIEAYRTDRLYILYSVLLGTLLAFALDIIIQLIYKWRRLPG